AVEIRAGADCVADADAGDIQARAGSSRQAFVDVESIERVETIIDASCIGANESVSKPSERVNDGAVARNKRIVRYHKVGIDETERTVRIEIADAAIDAAADQEIIAVVEKGSLIDRLK